MINNIELIRPFITPLTPDDFYIASVIKRKKEHPELGNNSYVAKSYCIKDQEGLDFYFGEMQALCNYHNARAYINLNKRSFRACAHHMLKKTTDILLGSDYTNVKNAYASVCSKYMAEGKGSKRWLIDLDTIDMYAVNLVGSFIETLRPEGEKVLALIPTKNGYHLITKPFHLLEFSKIYPEIEVKKNSPTLLFTP